MPIGCVWPANCRNSCGSPAQQGHICTRHLEQVQVGHELHAGLAGLPGRTWYVHMNCTNPVLDAASPERARVRRAGVEIAEDGMEIEL